MAGDKNKKTLTPSGVEELKIRLREAEEALLAIRTGGVDALVVAGPRKSRVFTLKGADHTYRLLVEQMHDGALVVDLKGVVLYCNAEFSRIVGVPGKNIPGKFLLDFVLPKFKKNFGRLFEAAKSGRRRGELELIRKGLGVPVFISIAALKKYDIPAVCVTVSDQTSEREKEKLRKAEERFRALFVSMTDSFALCEIVTDEKGGAVDYRMLDVNPAYEKFTGLPRARIVGKLRSQIPIPMSPKSFKRYASVALTGKPAEFENYNAALDKHYKVRVYSPGPRLFATIFTDISKSIKMEGALRAAEEKAKQIVANAPAMIYEMDFAGTRFISVNDAMCTMLGYSRNELMTKKPADLIDRESRAAFAERIKRKLAGEEVPEAVEYRGVTKDGREMFVSVKTTFTYKDGKPATALVVAHDITDRKRAEAALRASEERNRLLVKYAPTAIYEIDFSGPKFLSVNDAMCKMSGYSRDELLRMNPSQLLDERSAGLFKERIEKTLANQKVDDNIEYRVRTKGGREIWAQLNVQFEKEKGGTPRALVIAHDITERKKMEEALARSNAKLTQVLQSIQDDFYVLDRDWNFVYANRQFASKVGKEPDDFIGRNIWKMFPKHQGTVLEENFRATMEKREVSRFEIGGKYTHAWYKMTVFPSAEGVTVLGIDITEQKKTEAKLRRRQAETQAIFDNIPAGLVLFDAKYPYKVLVHNKYYQELFDEPFKSRGMAGLNLLDYAPDPESSGIMAVFEGVVTGKQEKHFLDFPYKSDPPNERWFNWYMVPIILDGEVVALVSMSVDVTDRHRAEAALRESEERFRLALQNAPVSVAEQDKDLRFVWAYNQKTIDPKEVIGKTDADIFDRESAARLVALKKKAMESGGVIREKLWVVSNGKKRFVDVYMEPARGTSGEVTGIRLATVDLTQVKIVEEEVKTREEQFSKVFYSAPVGTCLFEINEPGTCGKLVDANETFLKIAGYERTEALGRTNKKLGLIDAGDVASFMEDLAKNGSFTNREIELCCREGGCKNTLVSGQVLDIGHKKLFLGMMNDITERKRMEESIAKLASFPMMSPNPIIELDGSGRIIFNNEAARRIAAEESGKGAEAFLPPKFARAMKALQNNDGSSVSWCEVNIGRRVFKESVHILKELNAIRLYAFDITDRKRMEAQLNKLNRTLWALSSSNQSLLHADDETELLRKICRIIVEDCGHAMVWIGYARNDDAKSVTPEAYAGFEKGYLERLNITWADTERGRGPTGTAIRTGKPQQCRNMGADPLFKPWREESSRRGYASSLALPLQHNGKVLGAITIYSTKVNEFPDEEEVLLLSELADNLAYGIMSLRARQETQRAQETLRETKEYLDNLLNYANAPIIVWGPDFKITRFNRAAEVLSGLKSQDVMGKNIDILFPKTARKNLLGHLKETLEGRRWETVEIPIRHKDGAIRIVVWNSAAIFDNRGEKIVATIVQGQDITEAKKAQKALTARSEQLARMVGDLKKLQLAVENASDAIFVADAEGRIISVNKAVEALLGYKFGDVIGKTPAVFDHNADDAFYRAMFEEIKKQKKPFFREVINVLKNGQKAIFELHISPVTDTRGKVVSFIGIERDRTEAKAIDCAKTEFISMASHQLRTPLSTLSLTAQMILNGAVGVVDAAARKQIREILKTADQMAALVDLLLNVSRIEMGRLAIDPQPMEIKPFIKEEVDRIRPLAEKKKIEVTARVAARLPVLDADRKILDMVLDNFLTNAVKYTPEGGRVTMTVAKAGQEIVFSVADTGIGIPKQQLSMVFTKMFRASNVGSTKGIGLGLNMAKNIIQQSGGRIWFATRPGKGSEFSIAVPLSGMKRKEIRLES
ncbi:MAG: PAS domain S-box protein [Candidatus Pacebacteria bacterium]|nr:PAS domain S-box protein [Candidatus Paceibacterota bacterium]